MWLAFPRWLLFVTALANCGSSLAPPADLDMSGRWSMIVTAAPSCATVLPGGRRAGRGWALRLDQQGTAITGTVEAGNEFPDPGSSRIGSVRGSVGGSTFTLSADVLDFINDPQIRVVGTLTGEVCGSGQCAAGTLDGTFGLQPSGASLVGCTARNHDLLLLRPGR
jgi:hypothetical protein